MTERCDLILAVIDAATDPTTEAAQTAAAVSAALEAARVRAWNEHHPHTLVDVDGLECPTCSAADPDGWYPHPDCHGAK